jgi:hypothetical protein
MPTELSIKRIVLRAVALKMATWSKTILHRLEASELAESHPAIDGSVGELIEKTSSAPPLGAEEVTITDFGDEPVPGGPPAHWLERVRRRAPQLLRPLHRPVHRTRLEAGALETKKTAAPLATSKDQPEKLCFPAGSSAIKESTPESWQALERSKNVEAGIPRSRSVRSEHHTEPTYPATDRPRPPLIQSTMFSAQADQKRLHSQELQARTASQLKHGPQSFLAPAKPWHKSSEKRAKFPTDVSRRLPKSLPVSSVTSPRSAQALDRKENSFAGLRSSNISRHHMRETALSEEAHPEAPSKRHQSQRTASVFYRDGMVRSAPPPASLNFPLEPFEDLWPQLPEPASSDPSDEHLASVRDRERWRRLDDEQRGIYGARRIST